MSLRILTALPVYNEMSHVAGAIAGALFYCRDVLVIDDGSTDGSSQMLAARDDIHLIAHPKNLGYGMALRSAFDFAIRGGYDVLVTIDCDGQHQPQLIPNFVERCRADDVDIVSGSRFLRSFPGDSDPPAERRRVNAMITEELNRRLGFALTDAFCGFKAYRVSALTKLTLTETGYAMPLELWMQAARLGLRIVEIPVPLIYLDERRSFGGALDDAETRLAVYRTVLERADEGGGRKTEKVVSGQWPVASNPPSALPLPPSSSRLQTPQGDRSALVEPPFAKVRNLVDENLRLQEQRRYDLNGRQLADIAHLARGELLDAARRWTSGYRNVSSAPSDSQGLIYLAGHQPQMFHPGVWFKSFALDYIAKQHGATAVNLIVDNDVVSDVSLRVPTGTVLEPHAIQIPFDRSDPKIPYEERRIEDRAIFAGFGRHVAEKLAPLVTDPLIEQYWPLVCSRATETDNLGACLAQARHQWEDSWGLKTLEIPMSQVCSGEGFQWFTAHLLARLAEFRAIHNEAVRHYRREHRIRGISHPVPELAEEDGWLEAPFWIWTAAEPQRRRLFARSSGGAMILTDRHSWQARLPLQVDSDGSKAVERLMQLQHDGVRIRSRALTTTLWARLALGDLFLHGIGGAKYDQVTDWIIERFFRFQPPGFMVVSATLLLPIEREPASEDDARAVQQQLRDMTYHPERYLDGVDPVAADLVAAKQRWIETQPTFDNARERCQAIRTINAELQPRLAGQKRQTLDHQMRISQKLQAESVLASREYAFCLYPESTARHFFSGLLQKMA